jgi:hypothetical protein
MKSNRKLNAILLAGIFLIATHAHAQSRQNIIGKVVHNLSLKSDRIDTVFSVIKSHPENKNATIVLLALPQGDDEDFQIYDTYLVIADTKTGAILYSIFESERYTSDAVRLTGLQIDTAPYRLAANVRAIGIRAHYTGSSRPNPYGEETLSLYIPQGKTFTKVLDDFVTYQSNGEWDTNCAGNFSTSKSVLVISTEKTNGYNNIQVNTKTTNTENIPQNDDCIAKDTETKSSHKLIFSIPENQYRSNTKQ